MAGKKWIKEGDEVVHYDNPSQKIFVESFVRDIVKEGSPVEPDHVTKTGNKVFMRAVKCHWWEGKPDDVIKVFKTGNFHTRELVPFDVGYGDFAACMKFLDRSNGR